MSGYLEHDTCGREILQKAMVLQKPFSRDMLVRQIAEAFEDTVSTQEMPVSVRS
jgi:hypothetical protein